MRSGWNNNWTKYLRIWRSTRKCRSRWWKLLEIIGILNRKMKGSVLWTFMIRSSRIWSYKIMSVWILKLKKMFLRMFSCILKGFRIKIIIRLLIRNLNSSKKIIMVRAIVIVKVIECSWIIGIISWDLIRSSSDISNRITMILIFQS